MHAMASSSSQPPDVLATDPSFTDLGAYVYQHHSRIIASFIRVFTLFDSSLSNETFKKEKKWLVRKTFILRK